MTISFRASYGKNEGSSVVIKFAVNNDQTSIWSQYTIRGNFRYTDQQKNQSRIPAAHYSIPLHLPEGFKYPEKHGSNHSITQYSAGGPIGFQYAPFLLTKFKDPVINPTLCANHR